MESWELSQSTGPTLHWFYVNNSENRYMAHQFSFLKCCLRQRPHQKVNLEDPVHLSPESKSLGVGEGQSSQRTHSGWKSMQTTQKAPPAGCQFGENNNLRYYEM